MKYGIGVWLIAAVLAGGAGPAAAESARAFETRYDYNMAGQLAAVHKPDGAVIRSEYYPDGRLFAVEGPEGRTEFVYDKNGNTLKVRNGAGATNYFYDAMNRLTGVSYDYPQLKKGLVYEYDGEGRTSRLAVVAGKEEEFAVGYTRDIGGRLVKVQAGKMTVSYSYDQARHEMVRTLPNGVRSTFAFDGNHRLRSIEHAGPKGVLARFDYEYGADGLLKTAVEAVGGSKVAIEYEYDAAGRLTAAKGSDGQTYRYGYDKMGNRVVAEEPSGRRRATFGWAGEVERNGERGFSHDANGSLAGWRQGGEAAALKYDAANRLTGAVVDSEKIDYVRSAEGVVVAHTGPGGTASYVADPREPTWRPVSAGEERYYVWADRQAVALVNKGVATYLLEDRLGSIRLAISEGGGVVKTARYSPFGAPEAGTGEKTVAGMEVGYAGLLTDTATGFCMTPARSYAPRLGRFVQVELASPTALAACGEAGGYAYCASDPVNFVDPTGRDRLDVWGQYDDMLDQIQYQYIDAMKVAADELKELGFEKEATKWSNRLMIASGLDAAARDIAQWQERGPRGWGDRVEFAALSQTTQWGVSTAVSYGPLYDKMVVGVANILESAKNPVVAGLGRYAPGLGVVSVPLASLTFDALRKRPRYELVADGLDAVVGAAWLRFGPVAAGAAQWSAKVIREDNNVKHFFDVVMGADAQETNLRIEELKNQDAVNIRRAWNVMHPEALGQPFEPKGVKFDKAAEFFGQVGAIRGVRFDRRSGRLELIGDANPALPAVRMDDFTTAMQIAYAADTGEGDSPQFSLDPADPANPGGDWLKAVYLPGRLAGTHMGDVMFEADWVLKQYAFGVLADREGHIMGRRSSAVRGYKSYLELLKEDPRELAKGEVCSRFWILPLEMKIALSEDKKTLVFVKDTMQVQTRRMDMSAGKLADSPDQNDPVAQRFTAFFTEHYDELAREAPILEEARQAAKVVAIVKWLKEQGLDGKDLAADWQKPVRHEDYVKRVHSLSVSECMSTWGMGSTVVQIVGGVDLGARLEGVAASPEVRGIARSFEGLAEGTAGAEEATVGEVVSRDGRPWRFSVLPITKGGEEAVGKSFVESRDGVTWVADAEKHVRQAFDEKGGSASFDYTPDNRLRQVHVREPDGWDLRGTLKEDAGSEFRVKSPNGDDFLYEYGPDHLPREAKVNQEVSTRFKWAGGGEGVEVEHLKTVESSETPIGALTPKVTRTEVVGSHETLNWSGPEGDEKGEIVYRRESGQGPEQLKEEVRVHAYKDALTVEGAGTTALHIERKSPTLVVEDGPNGHVEYELTKEGDVRKITDATGQVSELFPDNGKRADGLTVALRTVRGGKEAEVAVGRDCVATRDFHGVETVCRYKEGRLETVTSAGGTTAYEYEPATGRLSGVRFPDGSVLGFKWDVGAGASRLSVWRERAAVAATRRGSDTRPSQEGE